MTTIATRSAPAPLAGQFGSLLCPEAPSLLSACPAARRHRVTPPACHACPPPQGDVRELPSEAGVGRAALLPGDGGPGGGWGVPGAGPPSTSNLTEHEIGVSMVC